MRIALGIEYCGSNYHGWQKQEKDDLCTVQTTVEAALSKVANQTISISCAGRTDVGVHALSQVIHFDVDDAIDRSADAWVLGVNTYLPPDIKILWSRLVPVDFHARFSATARRYRYFIYNTRTRSAIFERKVTWHPFHLDEKLMHEAAQHLLGEHDFSSFRGVGCQSKSAKRLITLLDVQRENSMVIIDIKANAFLLHMVRNIAGLLMAIGVGKKPVSWAQELLVACDRKIGEVTAAPDGLYLMQVDYPEQYAIPNNLHDSCVLKWC